MTIEPGKELVLDLVVNGESDFGKVRTNLSEVDQTGQFAVASVGFEREFIRQFTVNGNEGRLGLKSERATKTKIDGFGRGHRRFGHHQELTAIGLDAGESRFALR